MGGPWKWLPDLGAGGGGTKATAERGTTSEKERKHSWGKGPKQPQGPLLCGMSSLPPRLPALFAGPGQGITLLADPPPGGGSKCELQPPTASERIWMAHPSCHSPTKFQNWDCLAMGKGSSLASW